MSRRVSPRAYALAAFLVLVLCVVVTSGDAGSKVANPLITRDGSGELSTFDKNGGIDISNPFFQNLGSNGRTCNSCHVSSEAWTVTPAGIQARFQSSHGTDPIFRPVDGANCPSAPVSTEAERASSYRLLLSKGLIRISLPVPANAEFTIVDIDDPYNCAETTTTTPAFYRRPLPSTNLGFLSTVMWDGRESGGGKSMEASLASQAIDATTGHAEAATPPTQQQVQQIIAFEKGIFTAQSSDTLAGTLNARNATGGPISLSKQDFFLGINDPLGGNPTGAAFDPLTFTTFNAWQNLTGSDNANRARRAIARGQALFNTLPIPITGVAGLNDTLNMPVINGFCTTCHDTPNAGNHSVSLAIDIGVTDSAPQRPLDVTGLPIYTVVCNATSQLYRVTDIGRAMVTGHCADIGKTKGPVLRALSARAPYFHNGSAATLDEAVEFYNQRFSLNLTQQQKSDLVAFLKSL
jgi:cytochrome c peroxidase